MLEKVTRAWCILFPRPIRIYPDVNMFWMPAWPGSLDVQNTLHLQHNNTLCTKFVTPWPEYTDWYWNTTPPSCNKCHVPRSSKLWAYPRNCFLTPQLQSAITRLPPHTCYSNTNHVLFQLQWHVLEVWRMSFLQNPKHVRVLMICSNPFRNGLEFIRIICGAKPILLNDTLEHGAIPISYHHP